jgi:hypothetical protein
LIPTIARFIRGSLKPRAPGRKTPAPKDLQSIRKALLLCIDDCESVPANRLRHKIIHAQAAQELWLLRNDAYQLISQQTSQGVAAQRINELISHFEGWVEPRQLVRIK